MKNDDKKRQAKRNAINHTELMQNLYSNEIYDSIHNSSIYYPPLTTTTNNIYPETIIKLVDQDTVSALFANINSEKRIAVLNFASYKRPGGRFLEGSTAQEEMLCHESTLYNVLSTFNDSYYAKNKRNLNKGLYIDTSIYSRDILFIRKNKIIKADVITCAAPNLGPGIKYNTITTQEAINAMDSRIRHILKVAVVNNVNTLILGAFGCGVFRNDPNTTAQIFSKYLNGEFKNCFEKVIFAIPNGSNKYNYRVFSRYFSI